MICFTDNDILHKLAAFDLWEEARTVLSVSPKEVLLLPTAPFVLGLKDPAKAMTRHGTALASRLQAMVATSGTVEGFPAVEDQVALAGVLGIDQGEAILIALASRSPRPATDRGFNGAGRRTRRPSSQGDARRRVRPGSSRFSGGYLGCDAGGETVESALALGGLNVAIEIAR